MNINTTILAAVTSAVAQLDFSEESAELVKLKASIADMEAAKERGRARLLELAALIGGHYRGPAGAAVADALLDDVAVADLAEGRSLDDLKAERNALGEGIRELALRVRMAWEEIRMLHQRAFNKAEEPLRPLAMAVIEEARSAAEDLRLCFVALDAIKMAIRSAPREFDAIKEAHDALEGDFGVLKRHDEIEVPGEIVAVLRGLEGKSDALRAHVVTARRR